MVSYVKAAYAYTANEQGELSFKEGDIITVTSEHPSGWWTGTLNNVTGTFPSNFTEAYTPKVAPKVAPKPAPRSRQSFVPSPVQNTGGGAPNPMAELQAKLARRNDGDSNKSTTTSNKPKKPVVVPRTSIVSPRGNDGPTRAPNVSRATTLAPKSNKPPPPSRSPRKKIDIPNSSVSNARSAIASKGIGIMGGNPSPSGGFKKPVSASVNQKPNPILSPRSNVGGIKKPAPAPRVTPRQQVASPTVSPVVSTPLTNDSDVIKAIATFAYQGTGNASELLFEKDAEITILQKDDSGWWEGELNGVTGWFPAEFVEEQEQGPTVAEKLAEVASNNKRLNQPKKAVRTGRRPPTRRKKAGHALKSVRTETNDPPMDPSRIEEASSTRKPRSSTLTQSSNMVLPGLGGPSRSGGASGGLRKTVAPVKKTTEEPVTDFRSNLRSTVAPGSVSISKSANIPRPSEEESKLFGESEKKSNPFGPRVGGKKVTPKKETPKKEPEPQKKSSPFGPRVGGKKVTQKKEPEPEPEKKSSPFGPRVGGKKVTPEPQKEASPFVAKKTTSNVSNTSNTSNTLNVSANLPKALGDYDSFSSFINSTFNSIYKERVNGAISCRTQLNRADSSSFTFAMCTIDGVTFSCGEKHSFSLQEAALPFYYAIGLSELGNKIQQIVSDGNYTPNNPMTLHNQKAQNPFCSAGAIGISSAFCDNQDIIDGSHDISQLFSSLAGSGIGCDMANIFASKKYNYSDKALAYWMQDSVPLVGNIEDTLDLYFQIKGTYSSCEQLACMAATIANNGTCPLTKSNVIKQNICEITLNMMQKCKLNSSCGLKLNGFGGESGALFAIVPNVGGFAVYSPVLNTKGVSARGVRLMNEICDKYKL